MLRRCPFSACNKVNRRRLYAGKSVGASTIKALSPNVFDRTARIESKILPEDRRLYKDDLNVSKSHRYLEMIFRSKAVNCFERNKQYRKLYPGFNRKPMQTTKKG